MSTNVLQNISKIDDSLREAADQLRTASGGVFGRIYEYLLMKFVVQGAQDNGEFFMPPSLVQNIVNVIEPEHGVVFDPACGSAGMFVRSSHFSEHEVLGRIIAQLTALTFANQKLRAARDLLLPRLMSGEIAV